MKNNATQKGASAPSAAEIAAVVAAFKSATREEQLVLRYRYLDNCSWEEISRMLNVSLRTVHRIHGAALQNFIIPD